jgi:UDP-glucose 4-epimerase
MILITGGTGYIGSHACIELLANGNDLIVVDNLSNSSLESLNRVKTISGKAVTFIEGDIRDKTLLRSIFKKYIIEAVVHFAGLKAIGESVKHPLKYYDNNVVGSISLFEVMAEFNCKVMVFSSTAAVYGDPASLPITEDFPLSTTNPYGESKLMIENILRDIYKSHKDWSIGILRYFNPIGAHDSGLIGENPKDIPNNLMPFVSQVAIGQSEKVNVFGDDYNTPDGTGVRDYIHVVDLAKGHVKALQKLMTGPQCLTVNLGTGRGYSVLEIIKAFEKASGKAVPYKIVERRPGDVAEYYADPTYAQQVLEWSAKRGIELMCEDAWRWQSKNPKGY